MTDILHDEWQGCYPSKWKGMIVPDAIRHPAKFSSRLISRIYEHMLAEGWLQPGDLVIDPFGGVALGALDAMRHGLRWRGVELEAKFAELGNQNIGFWNAKFYRMPHWCSDAILFQGDSRHLLDVIFEAHTVETTPPYGEGLGHGGAPSPIDVEKGLVSQKMASYSKASAGISSPPYADSMNQSEGANDSHARIERMRRAGIDVNNPVNVGEPNGIVRTPQNYTEKAGGLVSSPPYAGTPIVSFTDDKERTQAILAQLAEKGYIDFEGQQYTENEWRSMNHGRIDGRTTRGAGKGNTGYSAAGADGILSSPPYSEARIGQESGQEQAGRGDQYGPTLGQLGAMKADGFEAAISSPPFLQQSGGVHIPKGMEITDPRLIERHSAGNAASHGYGESEGQLGNMGEGNFDSAVTSPPYLPKDDRRVPWGATECKTLQEEDERRGYKRDDSFRGTYSLDPANLGNPTGADQDNFWLAARQIVEQVYLCLRPGAHAVWVVKGFVKDKQIVDFPGQWQKLCEAVGFETVHIHHAMLTNHKGTSHTLDGGEVHHKTEAKSFFRRNGENKARAAKWWEESTLTKKQKEHYVAVARDIKKVAYDLDVAKNKDPKRVIRPPTENIVLAKAQSIAWAEAGSPQVEISTSIDYETVLCMVRP